MYVSRLLSLISSPLVAVLVFGCQGPDAAPAASLDTPPVRVAAVGADMGRRAAYQIFLEGDLTGSITHVGKDEFNGLTVEELRTDYDVLLFTWATSSNLNADFDTRLRPFLELGGGVVFEDAGNTTDLAPGIQAAPRFPYMGPFTLVSVPGLTSGVTDEFPHNHFAFTSWAPNLAPLTLVNGTVTSLYGGFPGGGRLVVTGTDQHHHGSKYSNRASEKNQYAFLRNELCWAGGCVNEAPVAAISTNRMIECTGPITGVSLDASGSFDTDRDVLTYFWNGPFGSISTGQPQTTVELLMGEHSVGLAVADTHGAVTTESAVIRVQDSVAPTVSMLAQSAPLWSPDHKMVRVANVTASDACDQNPSLQVSITSNEPSNGTGDGNTAVDWQLELSENGTVDIWVRAERSGPGDGRTYTITVIAQDASANTATATTQAHVANAQ